jgi:hypothetical protein
MWEPRRLTTLCVFTARYRDSFSFTFFYLFFNSENVCCHSLWTLLSSRLLPKNVKNSLFVALFWCQTQRKEHKRSLRTGCWGKSIGKKQKGRENFVMKSFRIYTSQMIIIMVQWRGTDWTDNVARTICLRSARKILHWKSEVTGCLERSKHREEDNINIDLKLVTCERNYWINLTQDTNQFRTLVNTVMNLNVL